MSQLVKNRFKKSQMLASIVVLTLSISPLTSAVDAPSAGQGNSGSAASSAANKAPQRVTTASGLQYEDAKVGNGPEARAYMDVSVHYSGWLLNQDGSRGEMFDSSSKRNTPFNFLLGTGRVIRGWDEGVQGMRVGGKRLLIVPPALGYGSRGAGAAIPPNSTLLFEVELLGI